MAFDPNKPFEVEEAPAFDPNKPFTVDAAEEAGEAPVSLIPQAQAAPVQANAPAAPVPALPIEQLRSKTIETPQFWDTESQVSKMSQGDEDEFIRLMNDRSVTPEVVAEYTKSKGFITNPADVQIARDSSAKSGLPIGVGGYEKAPVIAESPNDGIVGAAARGAGTGILLGGLDEAGALVDTLGGTSGRENLFNSDRRFADIWADNQRKNSGILSSDSTDHPYAQLGGELAGSLIVPVGSGAKSVGELAALGAGMGGAYGFLGTDGSVSQRASGALSGAAAGGIGGAVLGKVLGVAGSGPASKVAPKAAEGAAVIDEAVAPVANEAVSKLNTILGGTEALNKEQKALYTAERRARILEAKEAAKLTEGEAGFFSELSSLQGKMERVDFEPQRQNFSQEEVDSLFDTVKEFSQVDGRDFYDSISARNGLLKVMDGRVPTPSEVDKLSKVFGTEFAENVSRHRTAGSKAGSLVADALTLPRALQSTLDLSAPLRQGINLIGTKAYWKSFGSMFKQAKSEEFFNSVQSEIRNRETFPLMEEFGLGLTDTARDMSKREEAFASRWSEKIPGVKQSERAYVGFLNKLRADTFDDLVNKMGHAGIDVNENPEYLKAIAGYVNNATGRGNLPAKLEQASELLNSTFYSPRLIASRVQQLNPQYYYTLPKEVRKEALINLLSMSGIAGSVLGLAALNGASVETDPRSSDFAKAKVGDTRYDVLGGFAQYLTFYSRLATSMAKTLKGDEKELGGKFGQDSKLDVTERFFENKFAPVPGFFRDWLAGTNPVGEEFDPAVSTMKLFIPLIMQDMYELVSENGPSGVPMAAPAVFGVGVQTYGDKSKPSLENLDKEHPVNQELTRLKEVNGGKDIVGKPEKSFRIDNETIELSEPQQIEYKRETEKYLTMAIDEVMKNPEWKNLTDEEKIEAVKELRGEVRAAVKDQMLEAMAAQPTGAPL